MHLLLPLDINNAVGVCILKLHLSLFAFEDYCQRPIFVQDRCAGVAVSGGSVLAPVIILSVMG